MSSVRLVLQGLGVRPPPFTDVLLDMDIVNTEATDIWVLLPLYLEQPSSFSRLLVSSVEVIELVGKGRVRIARFLGDGSFQALRLMAGVKISIHNIPITLVGEVQDSEICVPWLMADQLHIGTQRGEDWLEADLLSVSDAQVTFEPGAVIAAQDSPAGRSLSVGISGIRSQAVKLGVR